MSDAPGCDFLMVQCKPDFHGLYALARSRRLRYIGLKDLPPLRMLETGLK